MEPTILAWGNSPLPSIQSPVSLQMLRRAIISLILAVVISNEPIVALGEDFDSFINLELAFRETILETRAPKRFQSLIRRGETTITFVHDWPQGVGKTDFLLNTAWSYDYRYKTQIADGVTAVAVTPKNIKLKPQVRHVIRMPVALYRAEVWESWLLAHEFDHVAVSLDPRPPALLVHLCRKLPVIRFSIPSSEKPSDEQMRDGINQEIENRQSAILELIKANYKALDDVSQHGRKAMSDRDQFFQDLYSRSNLEREQFPYLAEVDSLLESEAYKALGPRQVSASADRAATP